MCAIQNRDRHRATIAPTGRVQHIQKVQAVVLREVTELLQDLRIAAGVTALQREAGAAVREPTAAADRL